MRRTLLFLLVSVLPATSACNKDKDKGHAASADLPAAITIQARGLVKLLPTEDAPQIEIHHEAMEDFVGRKGKVDPMMAMRMPFSVADHVRLEGIEVGDKVAFSLKIDWSQPSSEVLQIVELKELPAETELSL